MPWVSRGQMTDDELRALWRYIRSAPHDSLRWRDLAGRAASWPSSWRAMDLRDIGEEDRRGWPRDCRRWAPRRHSISSTRSLLRPSSPGDWLFMPSAAGGQVWRGCSRHCSAALRNAAEPQL